jgi:branched-chain amino acid transport system permease protein
LIIQLIEQILNGLVLGSIYALVASGLSLIWGSMKMLNFAHGELYMLGGFATYYAMTLLGLPWWLAIPLAMALVLLVGFGIEKLTIEPLLRRPGWDYTPIIATLGLSIFLQNAALLVFGERFKNLPYFIEGSGTYFGIRMAYQRLLILVVSVAVIVLFAQFLQRSKLGMALRAVAQDRDAATLQGIDVRGTYMWTFGISGALAALASAMVAPIFAINPWMGGTLLIKAFVVCVVGGLGDLRGAILGGILLGTAESLAVVLLSSEWKDVVSFAILIIVLWVRPSGFFGTKEW